MLLVLAILTKIRCAAGNANASARWKTSDTVIAADAGQAGHRLAFAASGSRCQAGNTAHPRRKSGEATAREAHCAGRRRCTPGAGAQGCSTATKGMSARQGHGGRERSARV